MGRYNMEAIHSLKEVRMKKLIFLLVLFSAIAAFVVAEDVIVTMSLVSPEGVGKEIGKITAKDSKYGLLLEPALSGLPPGVHGFHLHEGASCEPAKKDDKMVAAGGAGSHFDPEKTAKHAGPYDGGHAGDLPPVYVDSEGKATTVVLAPRLKTSDLKGHALVIHQGGDNFSDQPQPLGGGAGRIACGVIK